MKKVLFFSILTWMTFAFQGCFQGNPSAVKGSASAGSVEKKPAGKIEFSKELHNFGTVKDGEIVAFSFVFKNTGGSPIHVESAIVSCDCLKTKFSMEAILPNAESSVEVIFSPSGDWGNQLKTIEVKTTAGQSKLLTIVAYVENANINFDLNSLK